MVAISLKQNKKVKLPLPDTEKRLLTDFLIHTCVPQPEISNFPNFYNMQRTPEIPKNYKPVSAWEKARKGAAGGDAKMQHHDSSMNINS